MVKFDAIVATVDAITAYKEETNIHGAHVNKKRGRLILFPVSQEFFQTNNFFPLWDKLTVDAIAAYKEEKPAMTPVPNLILS